MKSALSCLLAAVGVLLVLAVPRARAGPISWTYQATAVPPGDRIDPTYYPYQVSYGHNPPDSLPGFSVIDLFSAPATHELGSATITALNLTAGGWATTGMYGPIKVGYHVTLTLTDDASRASTSLVFAAEFDGIEGNGDLRSVVNRFNGGTTKELTLGSNFYKVTIGPYLVFPYQPWQPGQPPNLPDGAIDASVRVQPAAPAPEPSTLLLASLGLSCLGLGAWRRWPGGRGGQAGGPGTRKPASL